jgi:glucose/arabinose dehydrogenase
VSTLRDRDSMQQLPLQKIVLPPGFKISVYAAASGARSLTLGPDGWVFVGTMRDKVYAIKDKDGDNYAETQLVVLQDQNSPNGVAFRRGSLFVAENFRLSRYDGMTTEAVLRKPPRPVVVWEQPVTRWNGHAWKFIALGPDDKMYVPVGAPCNVCDTDLEESYTRYGSANRFMRVFRMPAFGGKVAENELEVVVRGMRNTVGFDWHPQTKELFFTDNGRDGLGDNQPPDELNRVTQTGQHFGFPYCHGKSLADPKFGPAGGCDRAGYVKPLLELQPHGAALGMRFYTGQMFPSNYRAAIFIAQHGSWDSSVPVGDKVMVARGEGGQWKAEVFAQGWTSPDGSYWGRPVDVLVMPDGALLLSDDKAGVVYRISYSAR